VQLKKSSESCSKITRSNTFTLGQHPLAATSRGSKERNPLFASFRVLVPESKISMCFSLTLTSTLHIPRKFIPNRLAIIHYESARRIQLLEYLLRAATNLTAILLRVTPRRCRRLLLWSYTSR